MTTTTTDASLSQAELDEIAQAFRLFDTENRGYIDKKELKQVMESLGDYEADVVSPFLDSLEQASASQLSVEDFRNMFLTTKGDANDLNHVFGLFDTEQKGYITKDNLQKVATSLGEDMTDAELQEMMDRASKDGKRVTGDDFHSIMTKKLYS